MKPHVPAALLIALAGSPRALAGNLFPAVMEISALDGTTGFVLNGIGTQVRSGRAASSAGDVNGDGIDDLIIGARRASPNTFRCGQTYVVFGGEGVGASGPIELSDLDGANGFVLNGIDASDYSGVALASAGDVNGDGVDDLLIGASSADPNNTYRGGETYVVFGTVGIGSTGVIELSGLNGDNGFVLAGIDSHDGSGTAVSAGDINGDGVNDIVIGTAGGDPNGSASGECYVVFGGEQVGAGGLIKLANLNGANGFVINGINKNDRSGCCVSSGGDLNGDGIDDLLVGAPFADPNRPFTGECYVVFGGENVGATGVFELSTLNGDNGYVLKGADRDDNTGVSVSTAGDFNGDGVDDLVIGARDAAPNGRLSGKTYVVFGGDDVGASGLIKLSSLNGANGFVLNGSGEYDRSGSVVSWAGDLNGDGADDLLIGAPHASPNGQSSGKTYVVFSGEGVGASGVIELSTLDGATGFAINGASVRDSCGYPVAAAGDINGDGIDDILFSSSYASPNGLKSGQTYVVFGLRSTASPADINGGGCVGEEDLSLLLASWGASGPADINADGTTDNTDLAILLAAWDGC